MKKSDFNAPLKIALLCFAVRALLIHLFTLPDFINGALLGLSLAGIIISLIPGEKRVWLGNAKMRLFLRHDK